MTMTENGWGKERKKNGGPATANQVRDGWRELKQKYLQTERAIKAFNHTTSPKSLRKVIHVFRKLSGQTPYVEWSPFMEAVYNRVKNIVIFYFYFKTYAQSL
jgi:hypothetical protein